MNTPPLRSTATQLPIVTQFLPRLLLISAIGAVFLYWQHGIRAQQRESAHDFEFLTEHAAQRFESRFRSYENILIAGRGLFDSSDRVTGEQWHAFVQALRLADNYPGVRDTFFARHVERRNPGADAKCMAVETAPCLSAYERGFSMPNSRIEPDMGSGARVGYGPAGEASTMQAMLASCSSGQAVMNGVPGGAQAGYPPMRHLLALFHKGMPLETEEQRCAALRGWIGIEWDIAQWLQRYGEEAGDQDWLLQASLDGTPLNSGTVNEQAFESAAFHSLHKLKLGEREWRLAFASTPQFEQRHTADAVHRFALGALLLVASLWILFRRLQGRREQAEALAESMTCRLRESETRYHSVIDTSAEGYWLIELGTMRIIEVNDALCRLLGYEREELLGRKPFELADAQNPTIFERQAERNDETGQRRYKVELRHKQGHLISVQVNAGDIPHDDGAPHQTFALITDISERKRTEEQLRTTATLFETTSEAITVTDMKNRIVAVNPAFSMITGYSEKEVLGKDPGLLSSNRHSPAFYRNMWQTLQRMGRWQGEIWNRRKNGEVFPEWLSIAAIKNDKGETNQYMAVFSDITKRKRDEEKIWRQANYDALTGLPNRNLFKDRLDRAMHAAHRDGTKLALLSIDLDRFKWVNDTVGHATGDKLLQEAAHRLSYCVRESDTVARLGGDEFTVILEDIHDSIEVNRIADSLLHNLAVPFKLDGKEAFVSGSVGITLYPEDAEDMEQLLRNADAAMYEAKESGRNVFRYFTNEMNAEAQRRILLQSGLRGALERRELLIHYQPIVRSDGKPAGAEALARWRHPTLGFIPPDEFIPLAEESGIIVDIEQWVMRQACHDAVLLQAQAGHEFFMSVNISSMQCKSEQCRLVLGSILQDTGLTPACLKLEITERVMMENTEHVIGLLREVKSMGVRLAVDDFGTGYSSLSYLKQFPVDVLKIDRAFIDGLPGDGDDVALVEAIVAMAHSLNLQVVAEGVENAGQLDFLRSLGCDLIQGYYFSRPMPFDDFCAYLEK